MAERKPAAARKLFDAKRKRRFLKHLRENGVVKHAALAAGVVPETSYNHYRRDSDFAREWDAAVGRTEAATQPRLMNPGGRGARVIMALVPHNAFDTEKQAAFLETLQRTSNITRAARDAGISEKTIWAAKARDPHFAAAMQDAIDRGFEELAMTLLEQARFGVPKPVIREGRTTATVKTPDPQLGLRLLAMHEASLARRATVGQGRSDGEIIRERIEAQVALIRERLIAARPDIMGVDKGNGDGENG